MRNITKTFVTGGVPLTVLKDVNLTIERGELLAITGPSGSGKSTLMHLIGCLDTATSGTYTLDNKNISALSMRELARIRNEHIGFVFQKFFLLSDMCALDNVALPQLYAGASEKEAHEKARIQLERLGLGQRLTYYPNQLSGGQQQRVAIARALVNDPDIILADEPTGNLDSATGATIVNTFLDLNEHQNVTIIIVTHDPGLAHKTKRIISLFDGSIVEDTKFPKAAMPDEP